MTRLSADAAFSMEEFACKSGGGSVVVRIVENGLDQLCVGGRVFEEDTFLVLSTKVAVERVKKSREQLVRDTEQWISEAAIPGTVLVRGRGPFRLMAIVHDFNETPSWRKEWVAEALDGVFEHAEMLDIEALLLPLLGRVHGSLTPSEFVWLFRDALQRACIQRLKTIFLEVFGSDRSEVELAMSE